MPGDVVRGRPLNMEVGLIRGLMMDDEWAIVEPFLTSLFLRGGRPPANHRRVDGILWICRAGGATCRRRSTTGIRFGGMN